MYRQLYTEIADDSAQEARRAERALMERGVSLLSAAKEKGVGSPEAFEATAYVRRLWQAFIKDLANDDNALPEVLRAAFISIGLWILKECVLIDQGASDKFDALIEVNEIIAKGLG